MVNMGPCEHDSLIKTNLSENVRNVLRYSYKFVRHVRKKIITGDVDGINELLNRSAKILQYTGPSAEILSLLKNKCIISCMLSCSFAIHSKASYKRMVYMMYDFIDQIETLKTANEMVAFMMMVIKAYTYEVYAAQSTKYSIHLNQALRYINEHYMEKITLKKLAKYVNINPVYLSSLFMKETKISLSSHINKIRVNKSLELLLLTDKSINEIAFTVGYNYQNHFSAMFKKYTGMTPQEYRKRHSKEGPANKIRGIRLH
jgi:YesN/AraC family two-component response regulator